jgi:DNA-binding transcriptional regulator YiaG
LPPPSIADLRTARAAAGHTQAQAAALLSVSWRTLQDWERGIAAMPPAMLTLYLLLTDQHPGYRLRRRAGRSSREPCKVTA